MQTNLAKSKEVTMERNKLVSKKLGEIEYGEEDVITLSSPILGFPDLSDFLLISKEDSYPFLWLQSVEDSNVCFILIEPQIFHTDYKPKLNKREFKILGAEENEENIKLLSIVVVPSNPKEATVNLRAPILLNTEKKLAKQVILEDDRWQIKAPLFVNKEK
ncbi:flagellar assembly protein FliW [Limisalsivibrio acetivorans]|uniref:flagellar assembly protein FliW n=1 Tax=Limisalsivibrio acetivorans TaxID=1304888 RepID=UPI0003B3D907|nr:flagellar assembly protein FliW [Limisalsivibrio acetivorans]